MLGKRRPSDFIIEGSVEQFHERYILENELGRGGFSVVYSAKDSATGGSIAAKILYLQEGNQKRAEIIDHEVDILKRVANASRGCSNVLRPLGFYRQEDARSAYIVMEKVSGGGLFDGIATVY